MKTCKKLLAVTIALVLLVSTFVSGLVVSAAEPYSVTIADTEFTAGENATVNVTVDFNGDALDALHMLATVDTTLAIADAAIVSVDYADDYKDPGDSELEVPALRIKNDGKNLEAGKILFESGVDGAVKAKKVVFALTFADVAEGTYPIAINVEFTNYAEGEFPALTAQAEIVVKPAHVCEGTVLSDNGNGTHDVKCKCGEVVTAGVACEYVDGFCACGAKEPVKDPIFVEGKYINPSLYFDASVASDIAINLGGIKNLGYADYYVEITYSYYKSGYVKDTTTATYYSSDAYRHNTSGTVDYILFDKLALYEMPLDYTVKVCMLDAEGNFVAYNTATTSIQKLALAYAQKYSSDRALLTALVDMVNYGSIAQEYFAGMNKGSDIDGAVLPNVGFESYQAEYASDASDLPESFNTTNTTKNPVVNGTSTIKNVASLLIGASNSIEYKFQAKASDGYEASKLSAVISYTNAYGTPVTENVSFVDMDNSTANVYVHVFKKLALYDLEKTVHVSVLNDGVEEESFDYSVGYYVNQYIGNAALTDLLTSMELFAQSARIKLVGA